MAVNLGGGADALTLANVANTGSVSNVETLTGNADADTITLATAITGGAINLAGGTDTLIFGTSSIPQPSRMPKPSPAAPTTIRSPSPPRSPA